MIDVVINTDIINTLVAYQLRAKHMPTPAYLYDALASQYSRKEIRDALVAGIQTRRGKVMFYEKDNKVMFIPVKRDCAEAKKHLRSMQNLARGKENDYIKMSTGTRPSYPGT